jgi:hypothetical protein
MKTKLIFLITIAIVNINCVFGKNQPIDSIPVLNGSTVSEIFEKVETILKSELNENIKFAPRFKEETLTWLNLKLNGRSSEFFKGDAHFYSKIENTRGLDAAGISELVKRMCNRIKSDPIKYGFNTTDNLPTEFYVDAIEINGTYYFVYSLN